VNQILATVVRREGVPSELRLPSPNIVATATFRVSLYDFLSYSPPISWTIALILSASTAWLFPSTSTAWRYLRGLTPIAIPSATLWHPVTREHASHRVNQMHCPISSALKLESASEISRLHLTCAAGVPPGPLVFFFVLFTTNNSTPVNRKRCCSRHTRPNRRPSFAYSTLATM
jgi:hypothetical protein